VIFCRISDFSGLGANPTGAQIAASGQCDQATDPAAQAQGGVDDLFGNIEPSFQISAQVPVGFVSTPGGTSSADYAICYSLAITGPFTPGGPDETLSVPYQCETTDPTSGDPITVNAGQETFVLNNATAGAVGSLDVFVRDAAAGPITPAQVCIFDAASGALIACQDTDATGTAHFLVGNGTYTAVATATGFGSLGATCVYDVLSDAFGTGGTPTATCNVGAVAGIVDSGADSDIILSLAPVTGSLTVHTTMTIAALAASFGSGGTGVFVIPTAALGVDANDVDPTTAAGFAALTACGVDTASPFFPFNIIADASFGVTDDAGDVTFSLAPGTYCVAADPDKDGLVDLIAVTVPSGGAATANSDDDALAQLDILVTDNDPTPGNVGASVSIFVDLIPGLCVPGAQIGVSTVTGPDGTADFEATGPVCIVVFDAATGGGPVFVAVTVPVSDPGADTDAVVDLTGI